ncbi:MAG: hypothetical protein Kow0089_10210 [Desulfobulbaceae bacterium]
MDPTDHSHLEIRGTDPAQWRLAGDRSNVLLIALNMPGYYSLPVRILSLLAETTPGLAARFNVRFTESSIREPLDAVLATARTLRPEIIGFSVNIWNRDLSVRAAAELKKMFPDVVLLAGGQEVTNSVVDPLEELPVFDYVIDGEGENAFCRFLAGWDAESGKPADPETIPGLRFRNREGKKFFTGPAEIVDDLDSLPSVILAGLIDPQRCTRKLGVMIEGARGCPFRCGYCFEGGYDRRVRTASIDRITAEMDYMAERGAGYFHLLDPILCNSNPERLRAVSGHFAALRAKRKGAVLLVEAYAQHISEEIAAGLGPGFIVDIGLQTINQETNRAITRPFNRDRFVEGLERLRRTGASGNIYLICGLPHETMESFFQGVCFALEQAPAKIFCNELQLLNGTTLRRKALEFGYDFNPVPQYEVYSTPWMGTRAMRITLAATRMATRFYNLNSRSVYAAAPWHRAPAGAAGDVVSLDLASPCARGCPGCLRGEKNISDQEQWRAAEKKAGDLAGRDVTLRVGGGVEEQPLFRFAGGLALASILRTRLCAPPEFLAPGERIEQLFRGSVWHYTTFLTAPDPDDPPSLERLEQDLAGLQSLDRSLPLPGAAVLEPHLEIILLPGSAGPEAYLRAVERIIHRRPTRITVPISLDHDDPRWGAALAAAFDACIERNHWLQLPENRMRQVLGEDGTDLVIAYLRKMELVSAAPGQPPCFVAASKE